MSEYLDLLLSQPLPDRPDNGFSNRIAARIELEQLRRDRFITEVFVGFVMLAALVLPFTTFGLVLSSEAFTETGMALTGLISVAVFLSSLPKMDFK